LIKKLVLGVLLILCGINDNIAQNVEEIAFLTLVDSLYHSDYDEHKAIFSGYTEEKYPKWMPFYFEDDLELEKILEASEDLDEPVKLKIDKTTEKVNLKKYRLLNKPRIQVYPRLEYDNKFYVYITVYKKMSYVGHYFFEFDKNKNLINSWYAGEII
jgi:16S rRNA C967 or C1407 C5-methylase (RsmB/RsmF family)